MSVTQKKQIYKQGQRIKAKEMKKKKSTCVKFLCFFLIQYSSQSELFQYYDTKRYNGICFLI